MCFALTDAVFLLNFNLAHIKDTVSSWFVSNHKFNLHVFFILTTCLQMNVKLSAKLPAASRCLRVSLSRRAACWSETQTHCRECFDFLWAQAELKSEIHTRQRNPLVSDDFDCLVTLFSVSLLWRTKTAEIKN